MKTRLATGREAGPTRVMLVDDSAVVRGIMRRWIDALDGFEVIATAINGQEAIDEAVNKQPDIVVLDLEMPVTSGMEALPEIRRILPNAKILIASTLSKRNARVSLQAMNAGADEYIAKPSSGEDRSAFETDLAQKIQGLAVREHSAQLSSRNSALRAYRWQGFPRYIGIGSSTGGPKALSKLLGGLKGRLLESAVLVTQHMPRQFTELFGDDLAKTAGLEGGQACDGAPIRPGQLYLAPGGAHMRIENRNGTPVIELDTGAPINFCKPAVDPMLRSIADFDGENSLALVLTGMGSDGALGALDVAKSGGLVMAQDEASSTVWGMPGATVELGAAHKTMSIDGMVAEISKIILARGGK